MPGTRPPAIHALTAAKSGGFTYLGVLMAIALMGVALLAVSEVWVTTANRQKLEQLDWAGDQYAQAIGSYYYGSTGSVRTYPQRLEDLLEDKRYLSVKRHLRELYPNPFTGQVDWHLIAAPGGGVRGVQVSVDLPAGPTSKSFVFTPTETLPTGVTK